MGYQLLYVLQPLNISKSDLEEVMFMPNLAQRRLLDTLYDMEWVFSTHTVIMLLI